MAQLLDAHTTHRSTFLVDFTKSASTSVMQRSDYRDYIEISDDEDEHMTERLLNSGEYEEHNKGLPLADRRNRINASPVALQNSKRQRVEEGGSSSAQTGTKHEYPRASLTLDYDDGASLSYPQFFRDSWISETSRENTANIDLSPPIHMTKPEALPPYFDDIKLQLRMFRGPGFEHFPIPLNDPKHKRLCDEWDQKRQRRAERRQAKQTRINDFGSYIDPTIHVEDSESGDEKLPVTATQMKCLAEVLNVLPDVQQQFVLTKIRAHQESFNFGGEEIEILPEINIILSEILEMDSYPQEDATTEKPLDPFEASTGKTIVWSRSHRENSEYLKDCTILLADQFQHVPTHYIHSTVQDKKHMWDAFIHVDTIDRDYFQNQPRPYARLRRPRIHLEKKYQRSSTFREPKYYIDLVTELQAVKQERKRQTLKKEEEQRKEDTEKDNLARYKADGLLAECQCCFDDEVPLNRMVTCLAASGEHYFCFGCIQNLANTQIGLMRHEMDCMGGDGCKEKLDMENIGRALPYQTFNKLLLNAQEAEIAAAQIDGLVQCPFCNYKAICEPIEYQPTFGCEAPACRKVSCRKCHRESHLPRTCEQVAQDRGLSARHKVEEARSAALMRPCPSCKTNLLKEGGCNKMTCKCGAKSCYVCKADLSKLASPYGHFEHLNPRGRTGVKCPMYDTEGVDRLEIEVNEAEVKAIKEVRAVDDTIQEHSLQIETGKSLLPQPHAEAVRYQATAQLERIQQHRRAARREERAAADRHALPQHLANPLQPLRFDQERNVATVEAWRNTLPGAPGGNAFIANDPVPQMPQFTGNQNHHQPGLVPELPQGSLYRIPWVREINHDPQATLTYPVSGLFRPLVTHNNFMDGIGGGPVAVQQPRLFGGTQLNPFPPTETGAHVAGRFGDAFQLYQGGIRPPISNVFQAPFGNALDIQRRNDTGPREFGYHNNYNNPWPPN